MPNISLFSFYIIHNLLARANYLYLLLLRKPLTQQNKIYLHIR